jgi:hypothetical protein
MRESHDPLFQTVAVIDVSGNIEGMFPFEAFSYSLVEDSLWYYPGPMPSFFSKPAAYIVDNGGG